jgi:hypothetical protein
LFARAVLLSSPFSSGDWAPKNSKHTNFGLFTLKKLKRCAHMALSIQNLSLVIH